MCSTEFADIVVNLVALNGRKLVGRTRLQKQAYLLKHCGVGFNLQFTYYHYGPYSFNLVEGLTDAVAEKRVKVTEKSGSYGVPYAIFRLPDQTPSETATSLTLFSDRAEQLISKMKDVSDIVLELAATIVFLRDEWDYYGKKKTDIIQEDTRAAIEETRIRKPHKVHGENIQEAINLLTALELYRA